MIKWQPIETAPMDGTEILGWREDCGIILIRFTAPIHFATDSELDVLDSESAECHDWFSADFIEGLRLDGSEAPTHWMPLPEGPK